MMTVFEEKLSRIPETIRLSVDVPTAALATVVTKAADRPAIAIGSGGSAVAAEFLSHCRRTAGHGLTMVMTPMDLVMSDLQLHNASIWLFSAGADNPDIMAAHRAAKALKPSQIVLMTTNAEGAVTAVAQDAGDDVHVLPVADRKDGFLATHSMMAMVTALLTAFDGSVTGSWDRRDRLIEELAEGAAYTRQGSARFGKPVPFRRDDTVIILHDAFTRAVAVLLETSLWETGIAPVQRTDFRNFAHGRHVWMAKHLDRTLVAALTTLDAAPVWSAVGEALPPELRKLALEFGQGGRLRVAKGIASGLHLIADLGGVAGIDPGRPGRGDFAEAVYGSRALDDLAKAMTPQVRQKLRTRLAVDAAEDRQDGSLCVAARGRLDSLRDAEFDAIVLDYDGTLVDTERRLDAPDTKIVDELVRLAEAGIRIGIATGRGGSAGEMLRKVLPDHLHRDVVIGYYNGGHLRTLDVDIDHDAPVQDENVLEAGRWIEERGILAPEATLKVGRLQIALDKAKLADPASFAGTMALCPAVVSGGVLIRTSGHSHDVVARSCSKLAVIENLVSGLSSDDGCVLRIGDSGGEDGNDSEMLAGPFGISVGSGCGTSDGAWSLFGDASAGPDALLLILGALEVENGRARLAIERLGLDAGDQ
ncbi:hypothetical protein BRX43_14105 [Sphingomonas sp. S-NIH.Pt15_0812]|nr:hypothetical protein BRX43_14105 [Sphingomonas sp. S-NIH.Pt15_0812]